MLCLSLLKGFTRTIPPDQKIPTLVPTYLPTLLLLLKLAGLSHLSQLWEFIVNTHLRASIHTCGENMHNILTFGENHFHNPACTIAATDFSMEALKQRPSTTDLEISFGGPKNLEFKPAFVQRQKISLWQL